ncbi:SctQ family type III secretion system cytoplasmic ring protein BscQ [Melaminivora jejuensis]|uniref:type III secretion system cytoplasmic ring protein SctQ n=1 Tax=Melaminivora jejuensis TaxID=1267217 RepID=UPI001E470CBB|nr:type III secretion system cytoplasmic ring protein SctQ [Melaminivora jejuensis]UHJ66046.1 type III secretion system cytoplasmic ring protein SctQ [Melaminivora jejuensis]
MPDSASLTTPRPPLLRLSRTEAQARTTIAQRAHALPLRLASGVWLASLTPLVLPAQAVRGAEAVDADASASSTAGSARADARLDFEWAGAAFALCLPVSAVQQWLAAELQGASLPELPAPLVLPVLEAALAQVSAALQALGQGEPQLVRCSLGSLAGAAPTEAAGTAGDALPRHAFELLLRAEDAAPAIAARLHADSLGLMLLAGLLARRPPRPGPAAGDMPLLLRAELGESRLTLQELHSLDLGDVVLLQASFIGAQRSLWLSADGRAGVHVQLPEPAQPATPFLTVVHPWSATMSAPNPPGNPSGNPSHPGSADQAAAPLQELPVRLSFDVGELSLTLAQLQALQPGQVLQLGHPLSAGVHIRANGVLLGEGDLVEIDGQLGVAVRSLVGGGAAQS